MIPKRCRTQNIYGVLKVYFYFNSDQNVEEPTTEVTFEEAMSMIENDTETRSTERVPIGVKYDMGWQKRSAGRQYNSMSGVGVMIGEKCGKVIDYGVRCKDCRICTIHARKGNVPPVHDCFKNYNGSSRSMEADVAGEIVSKLEKTSNVTVETLIMDDDSATIARIRSEVDHDLKKVSDIAHVKCHLKNSLYKLQSKHSVLSTNVIRYLVDKCFSYAVLQNKGSTEGTRAAIENIVPHNFGEHTECGSWCSYKTNPNAYTHKYLPNGRALKGEQLRRDLQGIFMKIAMNSSKISPCASTSQCESFNNIVASKAPKSRHLSSSGSLTARVACAVCQKNDGSNYMSTVFQSVGISPGKFYKQHSEKSNKKRAYIGEYKRTASFKRRRLTFMSEKSSEQVSNELREGKSYESRIDTENISHEDVEVIPPPLESPSYKALSCKNPTKVFFDLETTSLQRDCDIVQLSAVTEHASFNAYVLPTKPISQNATEITGLEVRDSKLYYKKTQVTAITISECLEQFIDWCQQKQRVLLVAHNCKVFDAPRLVNHVEKCDKLEAFSKAVVGFSDTLSAFKNVYKGEMKGFSQGNLVKTILQKDYEAHNALDDAILLQELVNASKLGVTDFVRHSFSISDIVQSNIRWHQKLENGPSLNILLDHNVCSSGIIDKIASSGLKFQNLCLAHRRGGLNGLTVLLSERDVVGKIRVTKSKTIIQRLSDFISKQN